ncbi:hypothetical protein V8E36_008083 [Tilletia maclaganii]
MVRVAELLHSRTDHTLSSLSIRGLKGEAAAPRYLLWKLWSSHLPLASTSSWDLVLEHERASYVTARRDALRAPDGSLPPDLDSSRTAPGNKGSTSAPHTASSSRTSAASNLQVNNPLSLESSNPWPEYFASQEVLQTIKNDVERAFPDFETETTTSDSGEESHSGFFKQERVAQGLTYILFVWAKANSDIGYRQGMHEIAGAVWLARERSSAAEGIEEGADVLSAFCDREHIEHDTYNIFDELMRTHRQCFEWKPKPSPPPIPGQNTPAAPAVSAMIQKCEKVQDLIRQIDPSLGSKLDELEIEPQLWAMRWIRMLFLREFDLPTALKIWDGIFVADAASLELVDFLCIAMLLRIRGKLFAADNSTALQLLLRFPTDQAIPADKPEAVRLLLNQAAQLQAGPTPSTGVQVVMQNRDVLGIVIEHPPSSPTNPDPPRLRTAMASSNVGGMRSGESRTVAGGRSERRRPGLPDRSPTRMVAPTSPSASFASFLPTGVSEAAKGLYERSESLGINRALANTVTNVQRTVNAYAQQGVRSGGAVGTDGFPRGFDALVPSTRNARESAAGADPLTGTSQAPATVRHTPRAFQRFEAPVNGPASSASRAGEPAGRPDQMVPSYATYTRSKGRNASGMGAPSSTLESSADSSFSRKTADVSDSSTSAPAPAPAPPIAQYPPAPSRPSATKLTPTPSSTQSLPADDPLGAL